MSTNATSLDQQLKALQAFSACDVSDALLKLQKTLVGRRAHAGFLVDMTPFSPAQTRDPLQPKIIAPASTFKFIPKDQPLPPCHVSDQTHIIPKGTHWVDHVVPGTVVVISQPADQRCAVVGGIMAVRMKYLGVQGAVVDGRVRDLAELQSCGLSVFAKGTSTVGSGAEAKPGEREVPVVIEGVAIAPGDIIFCDPLEGVVVIPRLLLTDVLELMPKLVAQDDKVKEDVEHGVAVFEAFKRHRIP